MIGAVYVSNAESLADYTSDLRVDWILKLFYIILIELNSIWKLKTKYIWKMVKMSTYALIFKYGDILLDEIKWASF